VRTPSRPWPPAWLAPAASSLPPQRCSPSRSSPSGTAQVSFIQLFGIGTGIAIVLDATALRGLLVPAFVRLAGQLNWWSAPVLRRLYQRIGFAETAAPTGQTAAIKVTAGHSAR
jgi:hypothetical protein